MEIKEHMKNYSDDGRIKVYLAGPFFNEEQEERITFLENMLEMYLKENRILIKDFILNF